MSSEKNKSGIIIGILIGIIIALIIIVILIATGTISFNSNKVDNNETNQKIPETEEKVETETIEVPGKFKLMNNGVLKKDLIQAFEMLGLYEYYNDETSANKYNNNECLNYYVSQQDFRNNSKKIFALYILTYKLDTNTGQTETIRDVDGDGKGDISACGGAADCGSIKISDANKVIKLYNLTNMDEYLDEMPEPYKKSEYLINFYELTETHPYTCDVNVQTNHNIQANYDDNKNIIITDLQKVTEYGLFEEEEQIKSEKTKNVTYTFKQDTEGNYYLDRVEVK